MTTTQSIKNAWLKTITTTEDAKSFKIKESLSMPYTANVVLGPTKAPCSTKVYLTNKEAKVLARSVVKKFHSEVNNRSFKQYEMLVV